MQRKSRPGLQFHNGMVLATDGGAVVVEQEGLTPVSLAALVETLFRRNDLKAMGVKAQLTARADACAHIVEDLERLAAEN